MKPQLAWVAMHSALIIAVLINLFTGLRIATFSRDELIPFTELLPQGEMHQWHAVGAAIFIGTIVAYIISLLSNLKLAKTANQQNFYHRLTVWLGYLILITLLVTGLLLYFDLSSLSIASQIHYFAALSILLYIPAHAVVYFVQYGMKVVKQVFISSDSRVRPNSVVILSGVISAIFVLTNASTSGSNQLNVMSVPIEYLMEIDGVASEKAWQKVIPLEVATFGGANFNSGETLVKVKAVHNGVETFFHFEWEDATKSTEHLPLVKTNVGWKVQQSGYSEFDEKKYYEDKFAVMLSDSCKLGAAGTSHLGPKPIQNRPASWHKKGYHYLPESKEDVPVVDLWHWKAVRTNEMYLADDNYIGLADIIRPGKRRYSAGYYADSKESGAYVMNWQWYNQGVVTPKRLPKHSQILSNTNESNSLEKPVPSIPWFSYVPYKKENDFYPIGTKMSSVLYRSNSMEGDRADVRAYAIWKKGYWSLELTRKIDTKSSLDVPLQDDICLWVAAFDRAQIRHTRHAQPIRLKFR